MDGSAAAAGAGVRRSAPTCSSNGLRTPSCTTPTMSWSRRRCRMRTRLASALSTRAGVVSRAQAVVTAHTSSCSVQSTARSSRVSSINVRGGAPVRLAGRDVSRSRRTRSQVRESRSRSAGTPRWIGSRFGTSSSSAAAVRPSTRDPGPPRSTAPQTQLSNTGSPAPSRYRPRSSLVNTDCRLKRAIWPSPSPQPTSWPRLSTPLWRAAHSRAESGNGALAYTPMF